MEEPYTRGEARRHRWMRTRAPSAAWRERLLENCMARMKASRSAAVAASRAGRYAVVAQEAARMADVDRGQADLSTLEVNALLEELEAALDAERREAEQRALREHQEMVKEQDDEARRLHEFQQRCGEGAQEQVVCPVCNADVLHVLNGVVFCACGLRLDGGTYDNLTLDIVRGRLSEVLEGHARGGCCAGQPPTFSCAERFGFRFMHARVNGFANSHVPAGKIEAE